MLWVPPEVFRSPVPEQELEQRGADEGTASLLSLTQVRVCSLLAFTTQGWDVGTCFLCSIP